MANKPVKSLLPNGIAIYTRFVKALNQGTADELQSAVLGLAEALQAHSEEMQAELNNLAFTLEHDEQGDLMPIALSEEQEEESTNGGE